MQFGKRSSVASALEAIDSHDFDPLPEVTADKVNVVNANSTFDGGNFEEVRRKLTKTHGVLMLIAWPLLAVTAIFFPVFMKPVLPGGVWFQVREVLHICRCTLLLGIALRNVRIEHKKVEIGPS